MKQPIISIIIPVYNAQRTIQRAVESIINQTYKGEIEIIIVNDGSTDKTITYLESCEVNAINRSLIVFNQVNSGVSRTRNQGIELATGDYILFLDADDYYFEDSIEKYMRRIQETECDFLICDSNFFKEEYFYDQQSAREVFYDLFLMGAINSPWAKVYQSNLLKDTGVRFNPEISIGEDLLFNTEIFFKAKNVTTFSYGGYYYDQNESLLTHAFRDDYLEERLNLLGLFKGLLNEQGIIFEDEAWFHIKLCYSVLLKYIESSGKKAFKEKITYINCVRSNPKVQTAIKVFKGKNHIQRLGGKLLKYAPSWIIAISISLLPVMKKVLSKKSKGASI